MSYSKTIAKSALALILSSSFSAYADGEPGKFDYYLLTLSWSPEYCAVVKKKDENQCNAQKHYGFVVHGLWPQYNKGYPSTCAPASKVPDAIVQDMLPKMPSETLIQHEWDKHGTCSGKQVGEYFDLIKNSSQAVKIPDTLADPKRPINTTVAKIREQFQSANPNINMTIACKGKFLQEVRICLDKEMQSKACSSDVKDSCPTPSVIMRPVR